MTEDHADALLRAFAVDPYDIPEHEGPAEYGGLIEAVASSWPPPVEA